jgi:hypothetical protein
MVLFLCLMGIIDTIEFVLFNVQIMGDPKYTTRGSGCSGEAVAQGTIFLGAQDFF